MLTKDLLEVTKRKPTIQPRYRDVDEYRPLAERVIEAFEPGETRGEIEAAVAELETHDTFKLVRGLFQLIERRAQFEQRAPMPPAELRASVFDRGVVTDTQERQQVVAAVADAYGITPEQVEDGLWADREDEHVLVAVPDIEPVELLRRYNRSLTQTLLFDAVELAFTASGNYQAIFGRLKYLGLMYRVDPDLTVTVTGPATLFKRTRKYGTSFAKLLPSIMTAEEWSVTAKVETEVGNETRLYEFTLDSSQADLFPSSAPVESFDSEVERDFAVRIDALAEGWTVKREPTILRAGSRVMIPDFSFIREQGESETAFYLEIVGFWTPDYLEEKLAKVRTVEADYPLMLAVNNGLNCTKADFEAASVDQVFFYNGTIPVKPVLSRLKAIEERHVEQDLEWLTENEIEVSTATVTSIEELAHHYDLEPAAIRRYLEEHYPGTISNDRYVPGAVLDAIKEEVDALDNPTLAAVDPVLERYGVAQTLLESIGYTVHYTTLNQEEAVVRKDG